MTTRRLHLATAACLAAVTVLVASGHAAPFGDAMPGSTRVVAPTAHTATPSSAVRPPVSPAAANAVSANVFLLGNGFDLLQGSGCDPRGWTGEDRASAVYGHVWDSYLVNSALFAPAPTAVQAAMPNAANKVALIEGGAIVKTDSSGIVIADFVTGANGTPRLLSVYPGQNTIREYGQANVRRIFDVDGDPISKGFILANANGGYIQLVPGGATAGIDLAGKGLVGSQADTIGAEAFITPTHLAVAANGDVYFSDSNLNRLRLLRRNDLRVITLAAQGNARPAAGTFAQLQINAISGLSFGESPNILYVHDTDTILRLDLSARTYTTHFGPDPRLAGSRFEYSAGSFYWAMDSQSQVFRLRAGVVSLVVGQGTNGLPIFGPLAGASLGSRSRLYQTVGGFGLDSDDAGGVYIATGQAAYHLLADGTLQPLVGRFNSMLMGQHALCIGADSLSAPEEVRNWVTPIGFGNDWSQRVVSPVVDLSGRPNARITLDAALMLQGEVSAILRGPSDGNLLAIQALDQTGQWITLFTRVTAASTFSDSIDLSAAWDGTGMYRFEATLPASSTFGASSRVRLVVQTDGTGSPEDQHYPAVAAAILDNIRVNDGATTLLQTDFEDGTLQGWSVSARNQKSFLPGVQLFSIHDEPSNASVRLTSGFDFTDPTCVWNLTSAGTGLYGPYTLGRITSPWIAVPTPGQPVKITLSGKFSNINQARFVIPWVRTKNTASAHPTGYTPSFFALNSGIQGGDAVTPFTNQFVLTFPTDYQVGSAEIANADSIQIVWQVEDHLDRVLTGNQSIFERDSKFPYLDDFRVYVENADADADGIADALDGCVAVSAAGQDSDGDGCVDPTSTMKHVESWAAGDLPVQFSVSAQGSPGITDGSDLDELTNAAAIWNNVALATPTLQSNGTTAQTNASATDGVNLITFEDQDFTFPPGVLAVTPTLSFTQQTLFGDRIVQPGQIVDADMILNPAINFRTPSHAGTFDLRSVAVHEFGHVAGLSHSGTLDATMFFVLQPNLDAASLTLDDEAALAAAYPATGFATQRGTILGTVTRGSNSLPIPGALVAAVRVDAGGAPLDTVATDYTRADGTYSLRGLSAGTYAVRLTPLNGDVGGYPLTPEAVSDRVAATAQSNFQPEWRSAPETNADDADAREVLTLAAGQTLVGVDVITNIDVTAPFVVSNAPSPGTDKVRIDTSVLLTFSEAINDATLGSAFKLRLNGTTGTLGGNGVVTNAGRTFIFTPSTPLAFGSEYEIAVTTGLTDREGVPLQPAFSSTFRTETQPTVAITDVQPRTAVPGSFITVYGAGFRDGTVYRIPTKLIFMRSSGGIPDTVNSSQGTSTSFIAQVPPLFTSGTSFRLTGEVKVYQGGDVSNSFNINFLASSPASAPSALGSPIALGFEPSDAAIAPDGLSAIVVGASAMATVVLDPLSPGSRIPVLRPLAGGGQVVITPDGRRAYVTRPNHQDVIELDADPASGTYGTPRDTILVEGSPNGITLSQSGLAAFVTLQDSVRLVTIDVDPKSLTRGNVIRSYRLAARPNGGVAVDALSLYAWLTAQNGLSSLYLPTGAITNRPTPSATGSSAGIMPGGIGYVYTSQGTQLFYETLQGPGSPTRFNTSNVSGRTADLAVVPLQTALLVANSDLNLLQVVSLDSTDALFRSSVADGPTGLTPVSVSVSALGSLAITANAGDRTLSVFSLGGTSPRMEAVVPAIARPGDRVAAYTDNDYFGPGSRVTVGGTTLDLDENLAANGGTFVLPLGSSREATVALSSPNGATVSLTGPIRIVPPTRTTTLRSANSVDVTSEIACVGPQTAELLRVSPDGKQLAVLINAPQCESRVAFYDITDDGPRGFAVKDTSILGASFERVNDIQFAANSKGLLLSTADQFLKLFDTDRTSPTYSSFLASTAFSTAKVPFGVGSDPLGSRFYVSNAFSGGVVSVYDQKVLTLTNTFVVGGSTYAMGVAPDGRYLAMGGAGVVYFYHTDTFALLATSAAHNGNVTQLAFTTDGRRVVAVFGSSNTIGVYNMDPSSGAIGSQTYYGLPAGMVNAPRSICAGGDGHSVLMLDGQRIWLTDVANNAVATAAIDLPYVPGAIGNSRDGRSVWVTENTLTGPPTTAWPAPRLHRYQLSDAAAMSLLAGGAQGAAPGTTLPTPIRVRLVDANGQPETGVQVHFTLPDATHGSLDFRDGVTSRVKLTDTNGEASVAWTLSNRSVANPQIAIDAPILGTAPIVVSAVATLDNAAIAPVVTDLGPSDGASGINTNTELVVRFNQPMDLASVTQALGLTANGLPRAGTIRLEQGGRDVFFRPTSPLPFDTQCVLSIASGTLDTDGQALAVGATSTFRTEVQPSLSLTTITPPAAAAGASIVISGSGFNPVPALNTVVMHGRIAPVLSASNASLVVRVPQAGTSGEVIVQTGGNSSNPVNFIVLAPDTSVGGKLADIAGDGGLRSIAVTPDGTRAYATNSLTNTVTALDLQNVAALGTFSVGLEPVAISMLPDGTRAYIANHGGDDVSVFGTLPASPPYHTVILTIPVGKQPVATAATPDGRFVVVVCEGDSTLRWIDTNPNSGTADLVVTTTTVSAGGKGVAVSPDGTRAYVATLAGIVVIDMSSRAVAT
ncbi:MAG: Ig-like domain-containing protein, partial [Candidatus Eisenbacteria bacterium]